MLRYLLSVWFILLMGYLPLQSQNNPEKQFYLLVEKGLYPEALELAKEISKKSKKFIFNRALAAFHSGKLGDALADFGFLYEASFSQEPIAYYLGRIHHLNENFTQAASAYKAQLRTVKDDDPLREELILLIKQCGFATKALYYDRNGFIESLGQELNSAYDDLRPIYSPNFSDRIYYSSNRLNKSVSLETLEESYRPEYNIFNASSTNGLWSVSEELPFGINSLSTDVIVGFSQEGQVLILARIGKNEKIRYLADTFSTQNLGGLSTLKLPLVPEIGDQDPFFLQDSVILFSSKRTGGYGGYDLYYSVLKAGTWIEPINLGPEINGPYDERAPFLSNGGQSLFFSSNRENSYGGFDFYSAVYGQEGGRWLEVNNLGYPISSTGNDLYFHLSPDGRSALFCSDRKESLGQRDLFIAYLKNPVFDQRSAGMTLSFLSPPSKVGEEETSPIENPPLNAPVSSTTREIVIAPMYYSETSEVLAGDNLYLLQNVLDMLEIYPETKLKITGHVNAEGSKEFELYFSMKRAETAADFLIKRGIDPERIIIRGVGSQYPEASSRGGNMAKRENQRLEVEFLDNPVNLFVSYKKPIVAEILVDRAASNFREIEENLYFTLKILTSNQMYTGEILKAGYPILLYQSGEQEGYNYLIGQETSFQAIRSLQQEVQRFGFQQTEIIPIVNGIWLSDSQAPRYLERYPELVKYLDGK